MGKSKKRKKSSRNPSRNPQSGHPSGPHEHDHENAVWIRTEPTIDGAGWMVTMELDADHTLALDRAAAMECAYVILGSAAYAEYDASVLRQMRARVDDEHAMRLVVDLRKDRPDLDWSLMAPFSLVPGVNSKAEPFLTVHMKGEPVGQWSLPDARTHAITILEALVVADLDAAYLRCLKGVVGLDDPIARTVVGDLADFRP